MRTPDQVIYSVPALDTTKCEAQFDRAIDLAAESELWPAIVRNSRDMVTPAQLTATILKYREAGWRVEGGAGDTRAGDTRARIWHPDCPEAQNEGGRQGYRA